MVSTLVSYVGVLGFNLFVTDFTGVGHIKMFSMSTLYVILHRMRFETLLPTHQANVPTAIVLLDKFLQQIVAF